MTFFYKQQNVSTAKQACSLYQRQHKTQPERKQKINRDT